MTEEKLAKLLTRLHSRTMEGRVNWEATARKNFYQVAFPEYAIQVGPDDHGDLVLKLYNNDNVLLEEVDATQLQSHLEPSAIVMMHELYRAAKRKALNTDKALDDLLSALEDDEN